MPGLCGCSHCALYTDTLYFVTIVSDSLDFVTPDSDTLETETLDSDTHNTLGYDTLMIKILYSYKLYSDTLVSAILDSSLYTKL